MCVCGWTHGFAGLLPQILLLHSRFFFCIPKHLTDSAVPKVSESGQNLSSWQLFRDIYIECTAKETATLLQVTGSL